ncbi:DUF1987 domain-containing protein [uncultured Oxalicibacterium sp.]|uniref:DUF1987 domain-containing protein n=1 Tax=uncultured Oxalicibacterium sp. TaxID=1168540 RepID=UPI0025DECEFD|nr:DUF1987 domain-containing protein [uncultured Oxalicibacterium sp.]
MDNLFIAATASTPEVDFRFDQHYLSLRGEAYPENAAAYWGNIVTILRDYLDSVPVEQTITFHVALAYFNSSSTKMLFSLFSMLNDKAEAGTSIALHWYHDEEDDTIYEFGQELQEDFVHLTFLDHAVKN